MVSMIGNDLLVSLESRAGTSLTVEEELEHYRQRFQSQKLVLTELQQQLISYKKRCEGVDAVALMLTESKQEVIKLTKQRRSLETAVKNLQNTLSAYGLSGSVNMDETEQFIPGTSRQLLDNMTRENAHLRSLLKSKDEQKMNQYSEELAYLRTLLANLELENKLLRAQTADIDHNKVLQAERLDRTGHALNRKEKEQVSVTRLDQTKKKQVFRLDQTGHVEQVSVMRLDQTGHVEQVSITRLDQTGHDEQVPDTSLTDSTSHMERRSKASQTVDVDQTKVDQLRQALKVLSDHCLAFDLTLKTAHFPAEHDSEQQAHTSNKVSRFSVEDYLELENKLKKEIEMNQRWQTYSWAREQHVHGLQAQIAELEMSGQKEEGLQSMINAKELENHNLRQEIVHLNEECNKLRSQQPHYDISIVEILKQQIQVCTEDFNTERKDRERAVNRAKMLQTEVDRLNNENSILSKTNDELQKRMVTTEHEKHEHQTWSRSPTRSISPARGRQMRLPFSPSSSLSPTPSPVPMSFSSTSSYAADRSSCYAASSQDSMAIFQAPARVVGDRSQQAATNNGWTSRGPQEGTPKPVHAIVSMPTLSVSNEKLAETKSGQTDLTCPKCSREFTKDQQTQLLSHIGLCSD